MTSISVASRQWATRPADQRFTSLIELDRFLSDQREHSRSTVKANRRLEFVSSESDELKGLSVKIDGMKSTNGDMLALDPTHWSFGQLAQLASAPPGYLRTLPAPLACDALNFGLKHVRDVEEIGLLMRRELTPPTGLTGVDHGTNSTVGYTLAAATGPRYGRIWNSEISSSLVQKFGDGITGDWRVPGEFGKAVDVTKANTTLYASDRDIFVFLADETNRITIPNRRNGASGTLARGFYLWNSEVGSQSMGAAFFLFDYACSNRTIWGVEEFKEVRLRHTSGAPDRWLEQVTPVLQAYSRSAGAPIVDHIKAAQAKKIDDVREFLAGRKFPRSTIAGAIRAHEIDEGRPMESLWDVSAGLTAYARDIPYQDERVAIERDAGKILAMA